MRPEGAQRAGGGAEMQRFLSIDCRSGILAGSRTCFRFSVSLILLTPHISQARSSNPDIMSAENVCGRGRGQAHIKTRSSWGEILKFCGEVHLLTLRPDTDPLFIDIHRGRVVRETFGREARIDTDFQDCMTGVISVLSSRFSGLRSQFRQTFFSVCATGVILSEPKSSRSDFSASMSSKVDSIGGDRYVVNLSVAVYSPPAL